jgi:hypothetical protein
MVQIDDASIAKKTRKSTTRCAEKRVEKGREEIYDLRLTIYDCLVGAVNGRLAYWYGQERKGADDLRFAIDDLRLSR